METITKLDEAKTKLSKLGYLDIEIPEGIDLIEEINRLRKEKNAEILAHYYQTPEIQDLSDFLGDSLQLARVAMNTDADMIVYCGVYIKAEAEKIFDSTKKVVLPDLLKGCSLAASCTSERLRELRAKHPEDIVVSYIHCDAGVKSESDIICTPSFAKHIMDS